MGYERLDLDTAQHIGRNNDITHIHYYGKAEQFNAFCNYIYTHMPNMIYLKFHNLGITEVQPRIMHRLVSLDCSYNPIKKLVYGKELKILIAPETDLQLVDVLRHNNLNYLKMGSIAAETRVTIDTPAEFSDFKDYYIMGKTVS